MKAAVEVVDEWNTYVTIHAYTPKAAWPAVQAGVKCIEHGQFLDEDPPSAPENVHAEKHLVTEVTGDAFNEAKNHHVKRAFGTDLSFDHGQIVRWQHS